MNVNKSTFVQHPIRDPLHSIHEQYRQKLAGELNTSDVKSVVISGGFWGGISEESAARIKTMIEKVPSITQDKIKGILNDYKSELGAALGNSGNAESRSVLKALDLKLQTERNSRTQLGGIHMKHLDSLAKLSERSFVEINEDAWDGVTQGSSKSINIWLDTLEKKDGIPECLRDYQSDLETYLNKSFLLHPESRAVLAKISEINNKLANT